MTEERANSGVPTTPPRQRATAPPKLCVCSGSRVVLLSLLFTHMHRPYVAEQRTRGRRWLRVEGSFVFPLLSVQGASTELGDGFFREKGQSGLSSKRALHLRRRSLKNSR
jgi:hypothetical protein